MAPAGGANDRDMEEIQPEYEPDDQVCVCAYAV